LLEKFICIPPKPPPPLAQSPFSALFPPSFTWINLCPPLFITPLSSLPTLFGDGRFYKISLPLPRLFSVSPGRIPKRPFLLCLSMREVLTPAQVMPMYQLLSPFTFPSFSKPLLKVLRLIVFRSSGRVLICRSWRSLFLFLFHHTTPPPSTLL